MIRILIADDHELFRAGIIRLLEMVEDIEVVGQAGTGREAVALCRELNPDVLLLDMSLPDTDGLEVTRQVVASTPETKVLMLTMHDNEEYAMRLMQAGAKGFLVKGISPRELPEAIKKVAEGKVHVTQAVMEKMMALINKPSASKDRLPELSDREFQVFVRLVNGKAHSEICSELCLSSSTVGTYRRRIMDKLGLKNNSEMIKFAMKQGLVEGL